MTERELREMVRASIARVSSPPAPSEVSVDAHARDGHASFARLPLLRGGDGDGACLIEPSVRCNHCGYCLSYGH
jgi:hypothetical protein